MRLFLAIELPEDVRRHLERVATALKYSPDLASSVTWVKRENLHVTLKFLGEVEDTRIPQITAALADLSSDPIQLMADRMLFFPKRGPVHVVGVEVGGDTARLSKLHAQIETRCAELGFMRESRAFVGHITLGRSRKGERGSGLMELRGETLPGKFPGPVFIADHVTLMQSEPTSEGSRYTLIHRQKFC